MRILQIHNSYSLGGGEDTVLEQERLLLTLHGHQVKQFQMKNDTSDKLGSLKDAVLLKNNARSVSLLNKIVKAFRPDICHVHNVFWKVTPGIFSFLKDQGIPMVMTIHNYRLLCTNGYFFRDGHICEDCISGPRSQSLQHRCFDKSFLKTWFMQRAIEHHWKKQTWTNVIDRYICLTSFAKEKHVEGGIPTDKISIKPNFIADPELPVSYEETFLFVGRFGKVKGADYVWALAQRYPELKIDVIGEVETDYLKSTPNNLKFLGAFNHEETLEAMSRCRALLFPSLWFEGMPMTIIEAFSVSKPVIAMNQGAMSAMIDHQVNGLLCNNQNEFFESVCSVHRDKESAIHLGSNARDAYERNYTEETNYRQLIKIYQQEIERNGVSKI